MQSLSSPCANTAIDRIVRSRDEHSSAGAAKILAHTLDKLPTNASSDCESTCARRYRFEARGGGAGVVAAVETDAPLLVDVVAVVVVVDDGSRQVWTRLDLRPVRMNAPIRWSSRTTGTGAFHCASSRRVLCTGRPFVIRHSSISWHEPAPNQHHAVPLCSHTSRHVKLACSSRMASVSCSTLSNSELACPSASLTSDSLRPSTPNRSYHCAKPCSSPKRKMTYCEAATCQ